MPEVSEVQTVAEDVVDLTVKPEQPEIEESVSLEMQQQQQPAAEEEAAELMVQKVEEKVGEAPKIVSKPEPKVVEEGQTVVFELEATGEPVPEVRVQWLSVLIVHESVLLQQHVDFTAKHVMFCLYG